jgi:hypothetical protein
LEIPRGPRVFGALFALGLLLRLAWLPLWGTFDTEIWKAWAAEAASDGLAPMYGPPDARFTRPAKPALFDWGTTRFQVDYPPGTLLVAWAAGKLYQAIDPDMPNRWRFNAVVNLPPFLASVLIAGILWRSAPGVLGQRRALLFWLNPAAILLAPVLGYQDPVFASLGLVALVCLGSGRYAAAAAAVAASALVKPQGALLLPVLAFFTLRDAPPRTWGRAAAAGLGVVVLILAPWWTAGYSLSALDGCLRPLQQNTLSPLGLNLWWIAGWVVEAKRSGLSALAPILNVDAFHAATGWDARTASRVLLLVATLVNLWILSGWRRSGAAGFALGVFLEVHAYCCFGTSVHENHTLLALVVAPLLVGVLPEANALLAGTSFFLFAGLFFAAGFGRRVTPLRQLKDLRALTVPDLSVLVAAAYVAFVLAVFIGLARARSRGGIGGGGVGLADLDGLGRVAGEAGTVDEDRAPVARDEPRGRPAGVAQALGEGPVGLPLEAQVRRREGGRSSGRLRSRRSRTSAPLRRAPESSSWRP